MGGLESKKCIPCEGGIPALSEIQFTPLLTEVNGWKVIDNHHLYKVYEFKDFQDALDYVNKIGLISEEEGHHPDISLSWGKVGIKIYTHKIDGLHENDFILAAKFDEAYIWEMIFYIFVSNSFIVSINEYVKEAILS